MGFIFKSDTTPIEQLKIPTTSGESQQIFQNIFSHIPYIDAREPYLSAQTFTEKTTARPCNSPIYSLTDLFFPTPIYSMLTFDSKLIQIIHCIYLMVDQWENECKSISVPTLTRQTIPYRQPTTPTPYKPTPYPTAWHAGRQPIHRPWQSTSTRTATPTGGMLLRRTIRYLLIFLHQN